MTRKTRSDACWDGERTDHALHGDVAQVVAEHFDMDVATVRAALAVTDSNNNKFED